MGRRVKRPPVEQYLYRESTPLEVPRSVAQVVTSAPPPPIQPPPFVSAGIRKLEPAHQIPLGKRAIGGLEPAVFVRMASSVPSLVPGESEFCRYCGALSLSGISSLWLPTFHVDPSRRYTLVRQLSFIARTFDLEVLWPFSVDDPVDELNSHASALIVDGRHLLNEDTREKLASTSLPLIIELADGDTLAQVVSAAMTLEEGKNCVFLVQPHRLLREKSPASHLSGLLYAFRRMCDVPLIVDSGQPFAGVRDERLAVSAVGSGADGVALDVLWSAATPYERANGLPVEKLGEFRLVLSRVRTTLHSF